MYGWLISIPKGPVYWDKLGNDTSTQIQHWAANVDVTNVHSLFHTLGIIHMKTMDSVKFSYKSYRRSQAFYIKKTAKVYESWYNPTKSWNTQTRHTR